MIRTLLESRCVAEGNLSPPHPPRETDSLMLSIFSARELESRRGRESPGRWGGGAISRAGAARGMGAGGRGRAGSGDVRAAARARGVELSLAAFGPGFRAAARAGGREVGWVSGFVVPAPVGILHLDSVQVLEDELRAAGAAGGGNSGAPGPGSGAAGFVEGATGRLQRMRGMYGLGLLLGAAAVCHGAEWGCRRAELLAINDGPPMYRRLVRHYERLGFRSVLEVGENGLSDLPHLLVWGGEGMRMDASIEELLEKWSPTIRMMARQGLEGPESRPGA